MNAVDNLVDIGLLKRNVPLGPLTTYKTGGAATLLADLKTSRDLDRLIASGVVVDLDVLILGRGSNVVIADDGFPGLVIQLGGEFSSIEVEGNQVDAGGAVPLPRLARATVEAGLAGLEFFVGIPGSVGGAVRQNAGCFGFEVKDVLVSAVIVDIGAGSRRVVGSDDLEHSYRSSNIREDELVTAARFVGEPGSVSEGKAELLRITRWRREHQPGGTLNAGSVFKNPPHLSAGELIDSLGLKGLASGEVSVSEKHANFFVAGSGATSSDIRDLTELVKDRVFELSGTMLEAEIQFVGFD